MEDVVESDCGSPPNDLVEGDETRFSRGWVEGE